MQVGHKSVAEGKLTLGNAGRGGRQWWVYCPEDRACLVLRMCSIVLWYAKMCDGVEWYGKKVWGKLWRS